MDWVRFIVLSMSGITKTTGSVNLALSKPASMSFAPSSVTGPEHAVDGSNTTVMDMAAGHMCSYLDMQSAPSGWWQVDLEVTARVGRVDITSSEYNHGLPQNFIIEVYQDPRCGSEPQLCYQHVGALGSAVTTSFNCVSPVKGRIVRITQSTSLFLCELAVYEPEEPISGMTFLETAASRISLTAPVQVEVFSVFDCGRACLERGMCRYFNYREQGGQCEIPSSVSSSDVLGNVVDWGFYEQDPCGR